MLKKFILWFLSPFHDTQEIQNKGYTEGIKKGQCNKWFAFDYCDSIRFTTFLYLIESLESISDPPSHNFIYVWRKSKGYYVLQILQFIYTFKELYGFGKHATYLQPVFVVTSNHWRVSSRDSFRQILWPKTKQVYMVLHVMHENIVFLLISIEINSNGCLLVSC